MGERQIYVVGIGPGAKEQMTGQADRILCSCDVIVGYTLYVDLLREAFAGKRFLATPMKQEADRCILAFEEARRGNRVAVVCDGDAGIYGMAGLMCELRTRYPEVTVQVVPGVTAANAGAALLGAPLMHDFAVISLSDLLTPWETIEKRLLLASEADFVLCLYNPASQKRRDSLQKACDLMLRHKRPETVCGLAQNIGREGETCRILTLQELREIRADMASTVYVGNSQTQVIDGKMVTPRGYRNG